MRVIAQRSPTVYLLSEEFANPPKHVQVLDLSIGRLFPPQPREAVLATGGWTMMKKADAPDPEELLVGIERIPEMQEPPGFNFTPAVA